MDIIPSSRNTEESMENVESISSHIESISSSNDDYHPKMPPPKFQLFEIAVARKLKNRSVNLMDTFLKLDLDGDGLISRSDLFASFHNMYGINLTESQLDAIFTRFAAYFDRSGEANTATTSTTTTQGMRYADFVNYIHDTALDLKTSSEEFSTMADLVMAKDDNDNVEPHTTSTTAGNPPTITTTTTTQTTQLLTSTTATTTTTTDDDRKELLNSSDVTYNAMSDQDLSVTPATTAVEGSFGPTTTDTNNDDNTSTAMMDSILLQFRRAIKEHYIDATRLFHKMDKANTREVSQYQIHEVFEQLGVPVTDMQLKCILSKFDSEGSGKFKFYQFLNLVSGG